MKTITRNLLETAFRISTAASKDETRPQLNGAHIIRSGANTHVEACDGHVLAREILVGDLSDIGEESIILATSGLKKVKAFLKEWKGKTEFDCELTDHALILKVGTSSIVSVERWNREFPRVDTVIPRGSEKDIEISLNPELLERLYLAMVASKRSPGVVLRFNPSNPMNPISVRLNDSDASHTVGVIMPMRFTASVFKVESKKEA